MSIWTPIVSGLGTAVAWYRRAADLGSHSAKKGPARSGNDFLICGLSGIIRPIESTSRNRKMTREVQASAAKTHLPRLLDEVERGETIIITRHGRPIARIVPETSQRQREIDQAIADIEELRKRTGKVSIEEILALRDEGRKY